MPNSAGRSSGTPYSPSVVHSPCRSGSPHDVRAVQVDSRFVCASDCTENVIASAAAANVQMVQRVMASLPGEESTGERGCPP